MPKRGSDTIAWGGDQWIKIREGMEEAILRRNAAAQEEEDERSSSDSGDEFQSEPAPATVTIEEMSPSPGQGVKLVNVFNAIRGINGERSRDGRSAFDDKYHRSRPSEIIEEITSITLDPNKILQDMSTSTFDCHLPRHGGLDVEYETKEGEWLGNFSGSYRGSGIQGRNIIFTSYQGILPRTDDWYWPTRSLDETRLRNRPIRIPAEETKLLVIIGNNEVHKIKWHDVTWAAKVPSPRVPHACESLSKAVIAQIHHNNPCGGALRPD